MADQTSAALNTANAAVKDAQSKVDGINDRLANVNTITVPDKAKYQKALSDWLGGIRDANGGFNAEDFKVIDEAHKANQYKNNRADENVMVDPNHLTSDQTKELTLFAADLLNQVRTQLGIPKVQVTNGSLEFAQKVEQNYVKDNWHKIGHDLAGINSAGKETGANGYEDAYFNGYLGNVDSLSMDDLKADTYNGFLSMLFPNDNEQEMYHARGLLGLMNGDFTNNYSFSTAVPQYFGLTTTTMKNVEGWKWSMIHYLNADMDNVSDDFDKTLIKIPSTDDLISELSTAKTKLQNAKNDQATKQNANDDAQSALSSANKVLATTQADVATKTTNAKNADDNLTKVQNELTSLQNQLKADQNNQKQAQDNFDMFTADISTKQANLQKANDDLKAEQAKLATAQKTLDDANTALAKANDNLNAKKQIVDNAQTMLKADNDKLGQLQTALSDLQNAPEKLTTAKQAVADAQAKLTTAQNELATATNKLNELKQTAVTAQANVDEANQKLVTATKNQQVAQQVLTQAKDELTTLQQKEALAKQVAEQQAKLAAQNKAKSNGYHIENNQVVDSQGNTVQGWTVKNGQMLDPNGAMIKQAIPKTVNAAVSGAKGENTNSAVVLIPGSRSTVQTQVANKNAQLPQTGDADSALALAVGSLLAMFGIGALRKRKY
ncbi:hypothetical protein CP369_07465 [Lactobacillus sp. UMNPBX18]|nr:hypothetical protein CP369_07465 [Lactobacillus sp. UMNPBX18]